MHVDQEAARADDVAQRLALALGRAHRAMVLEGCDRRGTDREAAGGDERRLRRGRLGQLSRAARLERDNLGVDDLRLGAVGDLRFVGHCGQGYPLGPDSSRS
jgi:hypothetical protein